MRTTAIILGAGYSHVAGLPLARDLLTSRVYLPSRTAADHYNRVRQHFAAWQENYPGSYPEQYLGELYSARWGEEVVLWDWAVALVAATLATPYPGAIIRRSPRYTDMLTRPNPCEDHVRFWDEVLARTKLRGVITLNYDLLAERSLRHRPMRRVRRPGCYYAGLPLPQVAVGPEDPYFPREPLALTGTIPICKLHGSLNWAFSDDTLVIYPDSRPALRLKSPCAIVPPIPEKETPEWLIPVWQEGHCILAEADTWLVCGYSLPDYDEAVRDLLRLGAHGRSKRVIIMSQNQELPERWHDASEGSEVIPIPKLPEGLPHLARYL